MKPGGKLLRLSEETSRMGATGVSFAKVTDAEVLTRAKRTTSKTPLNSISCGEERMMILLEAQRL